MKYPSISVGIITRNRAPLLEKCLNNLLNQVIKPDAVIIVNNNSSDDTKDIVTKYKDLLNIKYYDEKKIGIPFARNKVLKKCKTTLLAFTDDDCLPPKKWIANILKSHIKNPSATIIQGKTLPIEERSLMSILFKTNYEYWIWKNLDEKNLLSVCDTNNISLKVAEIRSLNLNFTTSLSRGSDVDFAKKVLKKGGQIIYDRKVKNYHAMRSSWLAFYYQRFKMGRAQIILNKKWPDSNKDKEFNKNYYKQTINSMFDSVSGFRKLLLFLIYKTYHQVFWFGNSQSDLQKEKQVAPQKYILNKKIVNITVAIATRNREVYLENCLLSLIRQTVIPAEVVIIDNASSDGTKNLCQKYNQILPIKYYYESQIGSAYARNKALDVAASPVVAFLDDDCVASSNWLTEVSKAHQKYPKVVAIQGSCRVIPFRGALSYVYHIGYYHWLKNLSYGKNKLLTLDTANASFKVSLIKKHQIRFDTKFTKYCDDEDFCQQLIRKKMEVVYYPRALVGSSRRMSRVEFFKERFRKGFAKAIFDQKWNREIYKHHIFLQGSRFQLKGFFHPLKTRLRQVILNPGQDDLKDFFNTSDRSRLLMFKVRIITALFELLYHVGYFIMRMKLRFQLLDEKGPSNELAKSSLSLAVMIITKDRADGLKRTLDSLVDQTSKPQEVIIVDGSKPLSTDFFNRYDGLLNIKYIYESKPGFGVARNKALYNCSTDIVATIDDDAIADRNWCENIVQAHSRSNAIAIQGRIICLPKQSLISQVEQVRLDKWFLGNLGLNSKLWTISTKNVSFKVKPFLAQGIQFLEDPLIGKYGSEDLDIANRIIRSKQEIKYCSNIRIFHFERKNIISYLKQQYRKGCSNAVYDLIWKDVISKPSYYLRMKKIIEPLLLIEAHPYTSKNRLKQFTALMIYFASLFFFNLGKKRMRIQLGENISRLTYLKNHQKNNPIVSIGVILINSDRAFLQQILYSLKNQSRSCAEVFIFDKLSDIEKINMSINYKKYFKLNFINIKEKSYEQIFNYIINSSNIRFLNFLDAQSDITGTWLEESFNLHINNPSKLAINGFLAYLPKNTVANIIYQFNYQTFIRRTMLGNKKNYWKLVSGQIKKEFRVPFFQFSNGSINLAKLRKANVFFKEPIEMSPDINLGQQPFTKNITTMLVPKLKIVLNKSIDNQNLFKIGWKSGVMIVKNHFISESMDTTKLMRDFFKSILAFSYFCIKNRYIYQLVPGLLSFTLYQTSFLLGVLSTRKTSTKRLVRIITR